MRKTTPVSLRLSPELNARLEDCAEKLRQRKHTLAQLAIEAAVEAIEKNGYRLVVPIEFSVTRVAATAKDHAESQPVSYGAHRPQSTFDPGTSASAMNEAPEKPTTSGTAGNTERKKKP